MKILKSFLLLIAFALVCLSCQRELFFDGAARGILKKDSTGNCLPLTVNGSYKVDSGLTAKNFIEVQVEIYFPGTFEIISDTVNGYYFHQTGSTSKGISTIRLNAVGKPVAAGVDNFIIKYGTSTCSIAVTVSGPQDAVYTLAGAPDICAGAVANGTYTIGASLTASNILTIQAIVTIAGRYNLSAVTNNGFSFSASGVFTTTGIQSIVLQGTGTPVRPEVSDVLVGNISSNCNLGITVLSDTAGKAIFSFDGSPDNCLNYTINGTYYAGIATTVNNNVIMHVIVTKPGTYSIMTNTANGIMYSCAGSFVNTGYQTVILSAAGTPVRAESTVFIPNTGTVSCFFSLDVQPLPPPAVFTLSGSPNNCMPVTVNGFYIVTKPLDAANTVVIQVDVSSPGSYTISTNTTNGMSFSATGVFAATGLQNVILRGSGIPVTTGVSVLTPRYLTSTCSFSVTVQ